MVLFKDNIITAYVNSLYDNSFNWFKKKDLFFPFLIYSFRDLQFIPIYLKNYIFINTRM